MYRFVEKDTDVRKKITTEAALSRKLDEKERKGESYIHIYESSRQSSVRMKRAFIRYRFLII